jgi:superfamily I DNA/RNA helicase
MTDLPNMPIELAINPGERLLLLGPPGTGKTTALLQIVRHLIGQGWQPSDFAIVSFTRAAVGEIRERLREKVFSSDWDGIGTLHSKAARAMGSGNFMESKHWMEFNRLARYDLTPEKDADHDANPEMPGATDDDRVRMVYGYARNRMIPLEQAHAECQTQVPLERLRVFAERLEDYKREMEVIDFTDVIEDASAAGVEFNRPIVIVDEAQDLSPLQIAFLSPSIARASIAVVAGDDDQAIFEFQGASPAWLTALHQDPTWRTHILGHSWRCPEAVRELAMGVIARVADRVPKEYRSRAGDPGVRLQMGLQRALSAFCVQPTDSVFVLCRGGKQCTIANSILFSLGVPYTSERGAGLRPYAQRTLIDAIDAFHRIGEGLPVASVELTRYASEFCRSKRKKAADAADDGLLPYGAKAALERFAETHGQITIDDLRALGCGDLVAVCSVDPYAAIQTKARPEVVTYLAGLRARYGCLPEPRVTVTTWHSSKGREADTVIVWAEIPKPCFDALESARHSGPEHRSAYVAVTRAKRLLVICAASSDGYAYPFPRS